MAEEKKEEIIELTEVIEEPSAAEPPTLRDIPLNEESRQPMEQEPALDELSPPEPPKPLYDYEAEVRTLREALNARTERWLATEGTQVLSQGIREIVPRIAERELREEVEKLKAEVEKIQALKEALRAKVEQWLDAEGVQVLRQATREILPGIGEELLGKEIEKLQGEVEKIRALREALNTRAEQWFHSEGVQVLKEGAQEAIPAIAQEILGKEIEKFQLEREEMQRQREALERKTEEWLASTGTLALEKTAREMFPKIAEEILRQEIARLKAEAEEEG